jgi:hypothetical protein
LIFRYTTIVDVRWRMIIIREFYFLVLPRLFYVAKGRPRPAASVWLYFMCYPATKIEICQFILVSVCVRLMFEIR